MVVGNKLCLLTAKGRLCDLWRIRYRAGDARGPV